MNGLPSLPEPECKEGEDMPSPEGGFWADLFTAEQMRTYAGLAAAAAVAADRRDAERYRWLRARMVSFSRIERMPFPQSHIGGLPVVCETSVWGSSDILDAAIDAAMAKEPT
jgi:hypothetical protein